MAISCNRMLKIPSQCFLFVWENTLPFTVMRLAASSGLAPSAWMSCSLVKDTWRASSQVRARRDLLGPAVPAGRWSCSRSCQCHWPQKEYLSCPFRKFIAFDIWQVFCGSPWDLSSLPDLPIISCSKFWEFTASDFCLHCWHQMSVLLNLPEMC